MKTKLFIVVFVTAITALSVINVFNAKRSVKLSDVAIENLEALANGEGGGLDCSYVREEGKCTLNIGAGSSIKLFNMQIIHADAQGNVIFDGKVVCKSGGSSTCKPIECYDLYQIF